LEESEILKISIDIDDMLFQDAARFLGTSDHSAVINAALRALVECESPQRLGRLGGTDPNINRVPRRRAPERPLEP
jgi:Arc/MetJ family transcription regulator